MTSIITPLVNDFSEIVASSVVSAGVGHLLSRVFRQIDPKAALVCGAVSGALGALFFRFREDANNASYLVGLALLILLPARVCERLNHPISFKASVIVATASLAVTMTVSIALKMLLDKIGDWFDKFGEA